NRPLLPHERFPKAPFILAGSLAAGILLLQHFLPGNHHGWTRTPDVDSMPGYGVESLEPGKVDSSALFPDRSKELGAQVCKVIFVDRQTSNEPGRHTVIINPILDPNYILPADTSFDKDGIHISDSGPGSNYEVYDLDGYQTNGGRMTNACPEEDIHLLHVKDTREDAWKYVAAGSETSLNDGDELNISPLGAIKNGLVATEFTMENDSINDLIQQLQQG
ncbi:MAG TPA: hypothetical protein VLA92_01775, partial [Candidatus Saccharimonadales bacterium]|nr:hypothetical protein [Candidatus Saccharimonadales bacterium]